MERIEPFYKPVYITQPLLPDIEELKSMLEEIWASKQLTNYGKMAKNLEKELANYLGINHLSLFSNGTLALQIACKVLRLSGEVITTPFTFAATTHVLNWCGLKPVFCDIEEDTLNLNPDRIEELITPDTTAILPVHVFGTPCNVDRIQQIADKYGLKVLYDAAHAFGVKVKGRPIGSFGDISMFSLHATKIYHTIEGGALSYKDPNMKERAEWLRNFGIKSEDRVFEPGTNAKLNELQAAVGLLVLKLVDAEIENRKTVTELYRKHLRDIPGIKLFSDIEGVTHNYPYFVIRIDKNEFGITRDELHSELRKYNVYSRRYFYPLCSQFQCYRDLPSASVTKLPTATKIVEQVLSLPLYGRLDRGDVEKICQIIRGLRWRI